MARQLARQLALKAWMRDVNGVVVDENEESDLKKWLLGALKLPYWGLARET